MVGTLTNVITSVAATESNVNDSPMFAGLVERTAADGFDVESSLRAGVCPHCGSVIAEDPRS
jgi:hypothetical protein